MPRQPSWFNRHLHWTWVLSWVASAAIAFTVGLVVVMVDPYVSDDSLEGIGVLISLLIVVPVAGWVLKKKGRSLAWLLLLVVPVAWIGIFALGNKNLAPQEPHQDVNRST